VRTLRLFCAQGLTRRPFSGEISRKLARLVNIATVFGAFPCVTARLRDIQDLLTTHGLIVRRQHPELDGSVAYLARKGELKRLLPGIYVAETSASTPRARIQALVAYDPNAVLTEAAAASVSFWPSIAVDTVSCAVAHHRNEQRGYQFSRRAIPAELMVERGGLRYTAPALTALDLCASVGGDGIDQALRSRHTTLRHLHRAMELTATRVGNRTRRELLLDSRDEPWSAAERRLHRLLRSAGITGWKTNQPVTINGYTYYLDVVFRGMRLVIEIDGREHHIGKEVFEIDRWRQNLLVLDGWCVLRFTWAMLMERPDEVMAMIRSALAMLARRHTGAASGSSIAAANWEL
jgi:very-short-patch-repair endonuclease